MKKFLVMCCFVLGLVGCETAVSPTESPTQTTVSTLPTDTVIPPTATATIVPTAVPTETPIPVSPTPSLPAELTEVSAHRFRINAIAIHADSTQFATASDDDTAKLWSMDGTLVQTFTGHEDNVTAVAFAPNQTQLISGADDGQVIIWDIETGEAVHILDSDLFSIHSLAVASTFFVSGAQEPHVWDYEGNLLGILEGVHRSNRVLLEISPEEDTIVSYGQGGQTALWQVSNGEITLVRELDEQTVPASGVYFSSDNSGFITASFRATTINFWGADGELFEESELGLFYLLDVAPSDRGFLYLDGGGSILVQNRNYLTEYLEIADGMYQVLDAKFSENGRLAFAGDATRIAVGNTTTGEFISLPGQEQGTELFALSPDGCSLITANRQGNIHIWDLDPFCQES